MAELTEPEVPATPAGDLVRAWMARTAEAAPHAALLLEERLRVQAREQARADAERAAAELEKVRRLAEAR